MLVNVLSVVDLTSRRFDGNVKFRRRRKSPAATIVNSLLITSSQQQQRPRDFQVPALDRDRHQNLSSLKSDHPRIDELVRNQEIVFICPLSDQHYEQQQQQQRRALNSLDQPETKMIVLKTFVCVFARRPIAEVAGRKLFRGCRLTLSDRLIGIVSAPRCDRSKSLVAQLERSNNEQTNKHWSSFGAKNGAMNRTVSCLKASAASESVHASSLSVIACHQNDDNRHWRSMMTLES